jgi:pimeloyl-ACP methyl ester carboxylesterase
MDSDRRRAGLVQSGPPVPKKGAVSVRTGADHCQVRSVNAVEVTDGYRFRSFIDGVCDGLVTFSLYLQSPMIAKLQDYKPITKPGGKLTRSSPPASKQQLEEVKDTVNLLDSWEPARVEASTSLSQALSSGLQLALVGTGLVVGVVPAQAAQEVSVVREMPVQAISVTEIEAPLTDPSITVARGPNLAIVDSGATPNGYLLLSLGGTNSYPKDFLAFDKVAASQGYSVLALDYPNTVITTSCKTSPQPDPCTLFREEIVRGEQVSDLVRVDRTNSIENRLAALLKYQAEQDPEHYADFLRDGQPDWSRIVVVGHSQGSGHAGFLAKNHPMRAAILLAGPQDTTDAGPASWMSAPSQTAPDRYLSFTHKDDFFDSSSQLAAVRLLREDPGANATLIDHQDPNQPIVMSNAEVRDAHMSVITPQFEDVWSGLLRQAVK